MVASVAMVDPLSQRPSNRERDRRPARRLWTVVRDAVTGRFVKRGEAKTRPASTVTEVVKRNAASGDQ